MPLDGAPDQILQTYWDALDAENKISVAVKRIAPGGRSDIIIKNRY